MSPGQTREERAHSIRTVLIASAASAVAAIVTSYLWRAGTPVAAAVTPVLVALVSELLYHPTTKITERVTSEGFALSRQRRQSAGEQPKPSETRLEQLGRTGTTEPQAPANEAAPGEATTPTEPLPPETGPAEPTRHESEGRRKRGRIHPRFVIVTALIAFVVAAAVVTLPELLGGESIGSSDRKTSFFGGGASDDGDSDDGKQDEQDPDKPKDEPDEKRPDTGSESDAPEDDQPKKPPAAAPQPDEQQGTQQTQTDTGSTSTTPVR